MDTDDDPSSCSLVHLPLLDTEIADNSSDGYDLLEHISLEYPSQSIAKINDNSIVVSPNTENTTPYLLLLKFNNYETIENFKYAKAEIKDNVNRIKINKKIYTVSDYTLEIHDENLNSIDSIHISDINMETSDSNTQLSYGIDVKEEIAISTTDGTIIILDKRLIEIQRNKIHSSDINDIKIVEDTIYSCSNDRRIRITDKRSNREINTIEYKEEINSIDIKDYKIAVGEDNGAISLLDLRKLGTHHSIFTFDQEHKQPITSLSFYNSKKIISTSDEKVCLWDTTIKESLFDHDGQEYYKQGIHLEDNIFVVTSLEGLCFFKPDL